MAFEAGAVTDFCLDTMLRDPVAAVNEIPFDRLRIFDARFEP